MRDALVLVFQVVGAAAALWLPPHLIAWAVIASLEGSRPVPVDREPDEDPDELPLRERQ